MFFPSIYEIDNRGAACYPDGIENIRLVTQALGKHPRLQGGDGTGEQALQNW